MWLQVSQFLKEIYQREREKISSLFCRFGHAVVTKVIQALRALLVPSLRSGELP